MSTRPEDYLAQVRADLSGRGKVICVLQLLANGLDKLGCETLNNVSSSRGSSSESNRAPADPGAASQVPVLQLDLPGDTQILPRCSTLSTD